MTKANNVVNILYPYRSKQGIWAFDDEQLGIVGEPFIGEINIMIDMYAKGSKNLIIYISSNPLPGQSLSLTKYNDGGTEGLYQLDGTEIIGYLCPCTLNYFPGYPERIYARIELPKE